MLHYFCTDLPPLSVCLTTFLTVFFFNIDDATFQPHETTAYPTKSTSICFFKLLCRLFGLFYLHAVSYVFVSQSENSTFSRILKMSFFVTLCSTIS